MISLRKVRPSLGCADCSGTCGLNGLGDEGDTGNSDSGGFAVSPGYDSSGNQIITADTYQGLLNLGTGSGTTGASSSSSINWNAIFAPISQILGVRYAVPQLNAGQSITTSPAGTQITQQPAGVAAIGASLGLTGSGSSTSLLLIGGAVLVLVMMSGKK